MDINLTLTLPSAEDFIALRKQTDWGSVDVQATRKALDQSLMGVCLYKGKELVGMARVIGDGVFNVYIQDVVVKPCYQRQGYGRKMLRALTAHMKQLLPDSCTVGLMAASGQDGFYSKLGFNARPYNMAAGNSYGAGMSAQLKDLSS